MARGKSACWTNPVTMKKTFATRTARPPRPAFTSSLREGVVMVRSLLRRAEGDGFLREVDHAPAVVERTAPFVTGENMYGVAVGGASLVADVERRTAPREALQIVSGGRTEDRRGHCRGELTALRIERHHGCRVHGVLGARHDRDSAALG